MNEITWNEMESRTESQKRGKCAYCEKSFTKHSNLSRHVREVHKMDADGNPISDSRKKELACDQCEKKYVWRQDLQRHINTVHLSLSEKSRISPYTSDKKSHMKRHAKVHADRERGKVRSCTYCHRSFKKGSNLARHVREVHRVNINGDLLPDRDDKLTCVLCGKMYAWKQGLQRHVNRDHTFLSSNSKLKRCTECAFSTNYKTALKRHLSDHKKAERVRGTENVKCPKCDRTFVNKRLLRYHVNKYHTDDQGAQVFRRKCCLCSKLLYGYSLQVLRSHYEKVHGIPMNWEKHQFDSIAAFEVWKKSVEKETTSSYVSQYSHGSTKVFKCHRSGTYTRSGQNKREIKRAGTCKINNICPSVMRVSVQEDNRVSVNYLPSHVGHKNELKHIRLTPEERKMIAVQVACKISPEAILRGIRGSVITGELQRIHLTNKKDILNIKQSFFLKEESMKHPFDVVREELKSSEDMLEEHCGNAYDEAERNASALFVNVDEDVRQAQITASSLEVSSRPTTERRWLEFDSRKRLMVERFQEYVAANINTEEQLEYFQKMIKQASVTVNAMNVSTLYEVEGSSNDNY